MGEDMEDEDIAAREGGPPLAPSLAARSLRRRRYAVSRSFRLHRPRGPFCASGYCHQCPVWTPHGGAALACETAGNAGARPTRVDVLRPIGRLSEGMPPWFYEERFGRPRRFRQAYLRILRHLSSAPSLPTSGPPGAGRLREIETEFLVAGGGPAGIAAAAALAAAGRDVTLVEREATLGGSARVVPSRWRGLQDRLGALRASAARLLPMTTCLGLYGEEAIAALVGAEGPTTVRFDRLVVATGAYDRPLTYEGNDLPGTIGVRALERLLAQAAFAPSTRIGVFAAMEEAGRAVGAAREAGVPLSFLAGPGDLPEAEAPSLPGTRLLRAGGRGRVRWVELEGAGRRPCDVLVLGFTQPTYELQVQAGSAPALRGSPGVVCPEGDPRIPILVVGEAVGHLDPAGIAEVAAVAVAAWVGGEPPLSVSPRRLPEPAKRSPGAFICLCEDVRVRDIEAAVAEGFAHAELVKRRTGAGTGACQGKLCLAEVAALLGSLGLEPALPTVRPPTRPVPIASLGARADG
ncbi:MAG: (2Fe-2S)-binding protein [Actinobacteria bacterium]|nr:(2Fe-2S)-binding protein [Actinomycetota bacterium]